MTIYRQSKRQFTSLSGLAENGVGAVPTHNVRRLLDHGTYRRPLVPLAHGVIPKGRAHKRAIHAFPRAEHLGAEVVTVHDADAEQTAQVRRNPVRSFWGQDDVVAERFTV